jgi:hypothetical protein
MIQAVLVFNLILTNASYDVLYNASLPSGIGMFVRDCKMIAKSNEVRQERIIILRAVAYITIIT